MDNNVEKVTGAMLDNSQREYKFKKTINVGGYNKTASFIAHIPTIADRIQLGVRRAKMLDGASNASVDGFTDDLIFMMAYLDIVLIKKPKWFNMEELDDVVSIREIFMEVSAWVNNFRRPTENGTNATSSSSTTNEENMEGNEDV